MTTVSNNLGSYLSSLFNNSSNSKSTSGNGLLDALTGITGGTGSSSSANTAAPGNGSYLLSLSEEARNYLANHQAGDASASNSDTSFLLTNKQRGTIAGILAKYKDAPFTQDTFNNILADLKSAGLAPDQLAAKERVRNINPTQTLLAALNSGGDDSALPTDTTDYQAKGENYLDALYNDWQKISTTVPDDATAAEHSPLD